MKNHIDFMERALQIAQLGLGSARPNPAVGAVIVYKDKIIGEGYTSPYGGPHAEVNAINSVKDKSLLNKATLYVTLEPCSHFGKTPPCSDLIIKCKIPKIVIGCVDDNPEVSGKGIKKLKDSGCEVKLGILKDDCRRHHKRFFTYHNKKRPYIILKWAQTADGFIAPLTKKIKSPVWISNSHSRQLAHKWRTQEHAILVGTNTALADNPNLTAREWSGQNPIRIVLDQNNRIKHDMNIHSNEAKTKILNKDSIDWSLKHKISEQICALLYDNKINSVIIEGGLRTLQTFIDEDLWDEARVFYGETIFKTGVLAPTFEGQLQNEIKIKNDTLKVYVKD